MSDPNYQQDVQYGNKVMVGCGCRTVKDVVTFIRERKIEYVELAWADEMGLWHNEVVPVSELTYASFQEGIPCKDGRYLLPDPLSARIAPFTQPNAMLFTCQPPTNRSSYLKTKQLSPGWIEMISKRLMENDKTVSRVISAGDLFEDGANCSPRDSGGYNRGGIGVPRSPNYSTPRSPGDSAPSSPTGSPVGSPGALHCPVGSPGPLSESPNANTGFIEWKLVRNNVRSSLPSPPFFLLMRFVFLNSNFCAEL
eukprot:Phypoly_transcript_08000.p1 GENE.Phypoly_transcript_08000~~Phypoly_transcript_08000.p1  ORF type:complete len:281 (+),score=30.81 Phypoly_transcript_08000:86-844(+)